eukprot:4870669-Pleurochrysis_carterae.AAC.2
MHSSQQCNENLGIHAVHANRHSQMNFGWVINKRAHLVVHSRVIEFLSKHGMLGWPLMQSKRQSSRQMAVVNPFSEISIQLDPHNQKRVAALSVCQGLPPSLSFFLSLCSPSTYARSGRSLVCLAPWRRALASRPGLRVQRTSQLSLPDQTGIERPHGVRLL